MNNTTSKIQESPATVLSQKMQMDSSITSSINGGIPSNGGKQLIKDFNVTLMQRE